MTTKPIDLVSSWGAAGENSELPSQASRFEAKKRNDWWKRVSQNLSCVKLPCVGVIPPAIPNVKANPNWGVSQKKGQGNSTSR